MWVDRLRACAYRHQELLGGAGAGLGSAVLRPLTPPGSRSHITNGEPSTQLQTLSLSVLDAFGSVHDIVHKVERRHAAVAEAIESLPAGGVVRPGEERTRATCHQPSLLLLKATSQATLRGVESALGVLQVNIHRFLKSDNTTEFRNCVGANWPRLWWCTRYPTDILLQYRDFS